MITSFSLYLGLMVSFWCFAWLLVRLATRYHWTSLTEETNRGHFQAIDGLRGILALSVYVHHAWCMRNLCLHWRWDSEGDQVLTQAAVYAVTMFFFITGFVFWTKLRRDPRPNVGEHLRSRLTRLAPAYWASLAVVAVYVVTRAEQPLWQDPSSVIRNAVRWMLFTLPGSENWDDGPYIMRIFGRITWTLRLEWIFYLIIPFCGWFAMKGWRTGLFCGLLLAAHIYACLAELGLLFYGVVPAWLCPSSTETTHYFAYSFSGGICVAALRPWVAARIPVHVCHGKALAVISLGALVGTILFGPPGYGWVESTCLIGPFLLIALGSDWFGLLTSRSVRLLGQISYSMYLLHSILLYLTFHYINVYYPVQNITASVYWLIIALLGGVVIAVSAVWFRLFEKPFMKIAQQARPIADPARSA